MAADIRENVIGLAFQFTVKDEDNAVVNLSAATLKQLVFRKPDDSRTVHPLTFITDGTDGNVQFLTTQASDLDQAGIWRVQVYVEIGGGNWYTDVASFTVKANL